MTQRKQIEIVTAINEASIALMKTKGHDYAGADILLNFKTLHTLCVALKVDVTKIEGVHIFYILIKIQRICNLIFSGKKAKNEAVEDTLIDLRNYTDLLNLELKELEEAVKNPNPFDDEIVDKDKLGG